MIWNCDGILWYQHQCYFKYTEMDCPYYHLQYIESQIFPLTMEYISHWQDKGLNSKASIYWLPIPNCSWEGGSEQPLWTAAVILMKVTPHCCWNGRDLDLVMKKEWWNISNLDGMCPLCPIVAVLLLQKKHLSCLRV